jgi:hypothetical protein
VDIKRLQKTIEEIGKRLPPNDDWMPALILESKSKVTVYGFLGDPMGGHQMKDRVADEITELIATDKPDVACWITTAWTVDFEKMGPMGDEELERWKRGNIRLSQHPDRIEIVNAYVYGERGPNEGEVLMMGFIRRSKNKGPEIKKWKIFDQEGIEAEGRFPEAVKEGFQKAKGGK